MSRALGAASIARALAFACAIPLVLGTAQLVLSRWSPGAANALALDALASASCLALLAAAGAALGGAPLAQRLGLRGGRFDRSQLGLGVVGTLALSHAAQGVLEWAGISSPALGRFDAALGGLEPARLAFPLAALALASACGEELFFRGLLLRGLAPRVGPAAAIGLSALAFGLAHGDLAHGAAAAVLGVYLGVLAQGSASVWPAIAAHAVNNAVALGEAALDLHLPAGSLATPLGLTAGVTLSCVCLLAIARARRRALQCPESFAE